MSSPQFSLETAKDILSAMNCSPNKILDAATLPSSTQNTESFLSTLFESIDSISPVLALSDSKDIIVIKNLKEHSFPKSPSIFFASKIAPISTMGIFQIDRIPFESLAEVLILPTTWTSGDPTNVEVAKERVDPKVMVYFPHTWLHLLKNEVHHEKIDPTHLLREIIPLKDTVPEETATQVIKFLSQCIVEFIPTFGFKLLDIPSKKGKSTFNPVLSGLKCFQEIGNDNLPSYEDPVEEEEEVGSNGIIKIEDISVPSSETDQLSPSSKKMFLMMKAQFSSMNDAIIKSFLQVSESKSSNVLRLEDKEGFLKNLPDHAKDIFINLRTSPSLTNPTELDESFAAALAKIKTKAYAYEQILFLVAKSANKKDIDCLIDPQTIENLFKSGEIRNRRPITSFERSFGLNIFALGPSSPTNGTFSVTSDTGNKHISFVADNVSELISAYKNLKFFVNFITGSDNSFASQGISTLLSFLDDNSIVIKALAKDIPNFIAELQIQTGNTWSRFVSNCAHEKPNGPPDFSHFIDSIESGRSFATVLRSVPTESEQGQPTKKKFKAGKQYRNSRFIYFRTK